MYIYIETLCVLKHKASNWIKKKEEKKQKEAKRREEGWNQDIIFKLIKIDNTQWIN